VTIPDAVEVPFEETSAPAEPSFLRWLLRDLLGVVVALGIFLLFVIALVIGAMISNA
jgi:hypothetical protein